MNSAQPLIFTLAKIENLMYQVTLDPNLMKGCIISNTSYVDKKSLQNTLNIFYDTMQSGLAVSPLIRLEEVGEKMMIKTACSLTVCGVLLKAGLAVRPKGGGLIEVVNREPKRFTEMLMYWATTIDPIDVLTVQGLTNITGMMQTGNGRILGNLQEAPMLARDRIEEVMELLASAEFTGVLEIGEPNVNVLGVSVERDHIGISLVGGTNLVAAARETGIEIQHESISDLTDISDMKHIEDFV